MESDSKGETMAAKVGFVRAIGVKIIVEAEECLIKAKQEERYTMKGMQEEKYTIKGKISK